MRYIPTIIFLLIAYTSNSQNIFTKYFPSNENYRVSRVKEDFDGNFILSGYKDVIAENAARPYVFKIDEYGQVIDSALFFIGKPYDWYIQDVLIDSNNYIFIGFSGDFYTSGVGPNDKSMFYLKTDLDFNPIDTNYYSLINNEDIGYSTSKVDNKGNIIVAGYSYSYTHFGNYYSFIYKLSHNGDSLASSIVPVDTTRLFTNLMIDSNSYFAFSYIFSANTPRLVYKYDSNITLVDKYNIPNKAQQFYSPIDNGDGTYFTSGYSHPTYRHFSIIKSTINGSLLNFKLFGIVDSTNYPAFYDALCLQNNYLYFAGSVYYNQNPIPPYGENHPSNLYLAKLDTGLNIIWEKLIGGDAYYTAMNVIGTSDGGVLMLASRNDITDNLNNLDVFLVKVDTNGNIAWTQSISQPTLELSIFPNPVTANINIELISQNQSITSIQIFDIQGKEILSKQSSSAEIKLDVSSLSSGVYLIKGRTNIGLSFSRKFVKE